MPVTVIVWQHLPGHPVEDNALGSFEFPVPRPFSERALCIRIASIPAGKDSMCAEIDVFGMIVIGKRRRQQTDDMLARCAAVSRHGSDFRIFVHFGRQLFGKFRDDMTKLMHLPLPPDLAHRAALILKVLLPAQNFPDATIVSVLGVIVTLTMLPVTKGRSLEELSPEEEQGLHPVAA